MFEDIAEVYIGICMALNWTADIHKEIWSMAEPCTMLKIWETVMGTELLFIK